MYIYKYFLVDEPMNRSSISRAMVFYHLTRCRILPKKNILFVNACIASMITKPDPCILFTVWTHHKLIEIQGPLQKLMLQLWAAKNCKTGWRLACVSQWLFTALLSFIWFSVCEARRRKSLALRRTALWCRDLILLRALANLSQWVPLQERICRAFWNSLETLWHINTLTYKHFDIWFADRQEKENKYN